MDPQKKRIPQSIDYYYEIVKGDYYYGHSMQKSRFANLACASNRTRYRAQVLAASAVYMDKMVKYLAGQDLDIYFYALGICNEATQNMDDAMEYHRFAFNVNPSLDYALGISRVYLAMGESERLKQTAKAKNMAR